MMVKMVVEDQGKMIKGVIMYVVVEKNISHIPHFILISKLSTKVINLKELSKLEPSISVKNRK